VNRGGRIVSAQASAQDTGLSLPWYRLGVLHGRLETAQAVGHHGTVNTVKRDMRQVWTERERLLERLLNQLLNQVVEQPFA
jgi:hypothetical protein